MADEGLGRPPPQHPEELDRHVIARRLRLTCIPVTHVEYSFDGRAFAFTSAGPSGSERFWADEFPARWTRVGRFFKAVMRDLNGERGDERRRLPGGAPRPLDDLRTRRIRIVPDESDESDESVGDQPPQDNASQNNGSAEG